MGVEDELGSRVPLRTMCLLVQSFEMLVVFKDGTTMAGAKNVQGGWTLEECSGQGKRCGTKNRAGRELEVEERDERRGEQESHRWTT